MILLHPSGPVLSLLKLFCLSVPTQSSLNASVTARRGFHRGQQSHWVYSSLFPTLQRTWSLRLGCICSAKLLRIAEVWAVLQNWGVFEISLILLVLLPLPSSRAVPISPQELPYICPSWHSFPYFLGMFLISVPFLLFHCPQWYL